MDEMAADGKLGQWDDHHNALDEYLSIDPSGYIMVYQATAQNGKGGYRNRHQGGGSHRVHAGTESGRRKHCGIRDGRRQRACSEAQCGRRTGNAGRGEAIFADQGFLSTGELDGRRKPGAVQRNRVSVFHSKSEGYRGNDVLHWLPLKVITGQAESIKQITIAGVLISSIIAL